MVRLRTGAGVSDRVRLLVTEAFVIFFGVLSYRRILTKLAVR